MMSDPGHFGVVYTNPEIASVGMSEKLTGIRCFISDREASMAYSGRFVAENEGVDGVCSVGHDDTLLEYIFLEIRHLN